MLKSSKKLFKISLMLRSPNDPKDSIEYLYAYRIDTSYRDFYEVKIGNLSYIFLEKENPFPITRHSNVYTKERINDKESVYFTDDFFFDMKRLVEEKKLTYIDFTNKEWSDELSLKYFD